MSFAARPTAPPAMPDSAEIAELRRNLTSAHFRNRTLTTALVRAAAAPTIVGVLPGPDREFDEVVFLSNGIRLEHRWSAEHGWRYIQAQCVPGTLAAEVDAAFTREAPSIGMAVVAG